MQPNNPMIVDATAAGLNTFWQSIIPAAVFTSPWWGLAIALGAGVLAVVKNLLTEKYPKLAKVFTLGLVEGAAFYRSKQPNG